MRGKGMSEEEIAAAFVVSAQVVKQRLRLASVSPALLEPYTEDGMTLDQLMAFTVSDDSARQEQVWKAVGDSWSKEPYQIRRMLERRCAPLTSVQFSSASRLIRSPAASSCATCSKTTAEVGCRMLHRSKKWPLTS
ncbi:hypothetical protein MPLB_1490089 [Mesorhizobium sp. ORS 3324]|nr:hypothetical protein MPLB_1490089 [Mesorhizobium sp. ORS 3324]